jgi:selenocysteine lyase/cysteine desulfurase
MRSDARRFETWEANVAANIGLGAAIDYALQWGIEVTWARIRQLADKLRRGLAVIPSVSVRDLGRQKCGIVTFTAEGKKPGELRLALAEQKINVSVSPREYTLLDMESRGLREGVVRASVHYYNSEEEIDRFCQVLAALLSRP